MDITLTIKLKNKNIDNILKAIELDIYDKGRAKLNYNIENNTLIFNIESKDVTSVRATTNAILLKLKMFNELDNKLEVI